MLKELDKIPEGLLEAKPTELLDLLGGPTLIHLQGRIKSPLFVVVLQHGNEVTGFKAMQKLLLKYQNRSLPRSLSIFISNVYAAQKNVRRLENQVDYNRVWPGHEYGECEESKLMERVVEIMKQHKPFANIDLHNNTGNNPHYACINHINTEALALASMFSSVVVYFTRPVGVESIAFVDICPSVTVECGKVGQSGGVKHAMQFVDACLHASSFSQNASQFNPVIYGTVGIVRLSKDVSFSFTDETSGILLDKNLDSLNFQELSPGTRIGRYQGNAWRGIEVWDNNGKNVADQYFDFSNNEILLTRRIMPSMFTLNEVVIRQDCLCYFMERVPIDNNTEASSAVV